jgi:hypothetical protein
VDPEIDARELVSRSWGLIREHAGSLPIEVRPPERE